MSSSSPIAYLSPEFGVDASLLQYAGGLGVLAGDHLKAGADQNLAMVGLGLFYGEGNFRQEVGLDGVQRVEHLRLDPEASGLTAVGEGAVDVGDRKARFRIWSFDVGSVPLYLLDTDVAGNQPAERAITDRLYGGDREHRLRQEIVLGMGGFRALEILDIRPRTFHLNEGHAGFLGLARIEHHMEETGASFAAAVEALRRSTVFTTHTPVAAGIDRFSRSMMTKYFTPWARSCGVGIDDLMELGAMPGEREFNMAAFCLRLAGRANGVSRLHAEVSRKMFVPLWPDSTPDEVPIEAVTNGVHADTWVASDVQGLLRSAVGSDWAEASEAEWGAVGGLPDDEIRRVRRASRARLSEVVRERATVAGAGLDPNAMVVGFARRFAPYKRATLLLKDRERLLRLLHDERRPVQLVFAGKAHPADAIGQDLLADVAAAAADPAMRGHVIFLQDYDMTVGAALTAGADLWFNNPIRGLEACGTSGMKAALNGALNCSILDGWWDEMYDGENGFALPSVEHLEPGDERDLLEAEGALRTLEAEVVPLYFGNDDSPMAPAWLDRVRHAWQTLGARVTAARMVREYVEKIYEPAAAT